MRQGLLVGSGKAKVRKLLRYEGVTAVTEMVRRDENGLVVERWTQNGSDEMREVRSTFVELQVPRDAVIGEIFCDAGFGNAEMIREAGFDGLGAAATRGTAQKASNGNTQRLARFDIVVGGKIGIAEKEHSGTNGSTIGFAKLEWRAS